ncbi:hypothetical protein FRC02_000431 [Tulasnella sp. 418]|nr:hypothetical protein FRC02_000431 [Tulasnella sp. 418]
MEPSEIVKEYYFGSAAGFRSEVLDNIDDEEYILCPFFELVDPTEWLRVGIKVAASHKMQRKMYANGEPFAPVCQWEVRNTKKGSVLFKKGSETVVLEYLGGGPVGGEAASSEHPGEPNTVNNEGPPTHRATTDPPRNGVESGDTGPPQASGTSLPEGQMAAVRSRTVEQPTPAAIIRSQDPDPHITTGETLESVTAEHHAEQMSVIGHLLIDTRRISPVTE